MNCSMEEHNRLLEYAAGKLEPGAAAAVEQHLAACAGCRDFAAGQRAVWAALDDWEAPPPSADFNQRLYTRIAQPVSWFDRLLRPARTALLWRGLPLAAAACSIMMIGFVWEQSRSKAPGEAPSLEVTHPDQVVHALDIMEMLDSFEHGTAAEAAAKSEPRL